MCGRVGQLQAAAGFRDGRHRGAACLGDDAVGAVGHPAHLELEQGGALDLHRASRVVSVGAESSAALPARSRLHSRQNLPSVELAQASGSEVCSPFIWRTDTPQPSQVHRFALSLIVPMGSLTSRRLRRNPTH